MNANVAVNEPIVEPITHPQAQFLGVHLRSSAAKISCLRIYSRVCGALHGCVDMSGYVKTLYWVLRLRVTAGGKIRSDRGKSVG